ncbi:MAG: type transport system permease protein [Solirubrobacteraceae bacterium]|nr:type transport system permease protein [Solirubrobacteraceae bacterium]
MNRQAWLLMTRNQFFGFVREPAASGFNVLVPFFIVVFQAIAYGGTKVDDLPGYEVSDVLPISATTMFVMIIGIFGMGIGLASMIEARSIAAYRLRPGGVFGLLSAYGTVLFGVILLGLAVSIAVLAAGWSIHPPHRAWLLLPSLLVTAAFFIAFGAVGASLGGSARTAQALSSALFFPFLFLSGAMFPLDSYPEALKVAAHVLPGEHVYNLFLYCWVQSEDVPIASIVYLLVGAVALVYAAVALLTRREDV